MAKEPGKSKRSKKSAIPKQKRSLKPVFAALACVLAVALAYFLFFSPVSEAQRTLPLTEIEPERLSRYLDAQELHRLPWYVFAGIDYAEYGEHAPMPASGRLAAVAARVSGSKQGNVSLSRGENEFEYATLERILERYPKQDNTFIPRAIERMRALSRISRMLDGVLPLGGGARFTDEPDLHGGSVPGLIGVAMYSNDGVVVSASEGRVIKCGWDEASGYTVSVLTNEGVTLSYAHLDSIESGLTEGVGVSRGAKLGVLGATGGGAEGAGGGFEPHLLFSMQDGAFTVNPCVFLEHWRKR